MKTSRVGSLSHYVNPLRSIKISKRHVVTAVALVALAMLPGADGGRATFDACMKLCAKLTSGGFLPVCVATCAIAAALTR